MTPVFRAIKVGKNMTKASVRVPLLYQVLKLNLQREVLSFFRRIDMRERKRL